VVKKSIEKYGILETVAKHESMVQDKHREHKGLGGPPREAVF
jgi:hypothetical protein